ncbi:MAG TPA: translocation/assembly module TamB domain-containing protein [Candidatus Udaeobacter sp.]|nr:translocation/assembly module TamB domain-containing protein [Candidatus Udaeobacter sp.]
MADDDRSKKGRHRHIWRRALIGLAVFVVLLIVSYRPILLTIARQIGVWYANKNNLKIDFRLEGNPLSYLTLRNVHGVATGPSAIESIDIESLYVDYSLLGLLRHGASHLLQDIELRGAQVALNPATPPPAKPHPKHKPSLPSIFPERIRLMDTTLIVRGRPNDLLVEHADLDLNPRASGELRIGTLQLPSGESWSRISGQTSYTNKNFILRDVVLSDQENIRFLNIDASRIDSKALSVKLDALIGGGKLSASAALSETASSLNATANLVGEKIATASLNKFLLLPENYFSGEIERLALDGTGIIDSPRTWNGAMSLRLNKAHMPGVNFDKSTVEISAGQGKATLHSFDIVQNQNEFHLNGTIDLPATFEDFGRTPANLQIAGKVPDLESLTVGLTGSIQLNGKIDIVDENVQATLGVTADALGFPDGIIDKLNGTVRASKKATVANSKRPWFAELRTAMEFTLTGVRYRDYIVDSVNGSMNGSNDMLGLDGVTLRRHQNEITISGRYQLPENLDNATSQPVQLDVALNASEIGDFWSSNSQNKISGPLQMTGHIERKQGIVGGQISLSGSNLKMRDLVVQQVSVHSSIANNVIHLNECSAALNNTDYVNATGTFNLQPPRNYSGKASASVTNLAILEPLLRAVGNQNQLAGSLQLDWEGSGNAQAFKNTGNLKLVLEKARYGDLQGLQANVDGSYSPDGLNVPIIFLATPNMNFNAVAHTTDRTLDIDKIELNQLAASQPRRVSRSGAAGQPAMPQQVANYAYGYLSLPFAWRNFGTKSEVIPASGKVSAIMRSENLDLKRLAQDLGVKSTISGVLNAALDASGTIADLKARLVVQARDLRNEQWQKMEPASFELTAQVVQDRLTASGKLQQTRIQPMEIDASMPFDLQKIVNNRGFPEDTPVTAKALVPRTSVNFIRQFVPELQQLDGNLGLDVNVSGTLGHPVFSGAGDMTVNVARFTNATLPALRSFDARLTFRDNALTLDRLGGDLAGGPFTVSGRVTFAKLTEPVLDLKLRAQSVLVARNDTLTIRADGDIGITGPLASATVAGNVALTDSHILKNIELIPIGLPGRPPPQPPSATPELSVTTAPLRDWKFNVAIKTKNPVEIRGNLASGGATVDLKLTGTGLRPGLQGVVQMQNVDATLPFSRLDVSQGLLTFDPSDSMNPKISLQGTSVIRDYTVRVYVYGTIESPQAIFSSEPPLPQDEIISLIATGATRQELSGTNVLAGRAAMLLFQELYRKIVKKGQPTQSNTVFNRLDLDLGTVDPRTGQQQATVRFKIDDHLVLTGDVGVRGDFRGRLKYLIRFR